MMFRNGRRYLFLLYFTLSPGVVRAQTASMPAAEVFDESAFREGLRQRGLTHWLEQYLSDTPPVDDVDRELRRREKLLLDLQRPELSAQQRQQIVEEAGGILKQLLKAHTDHPSRLQWRLELARDAMERVDPGVFDKLLLFNLPGRDRCRASELSTQAVDILETLRQQLAEQWRSFEALDEAAIEKLAATGAWVAVEKLDARTALLAAWARLYHVISTEMPLAQRKEEFVALLDEVTQRRGWTQLPAGHEAQRCSALIIAAIAARGAGRLADADRYARDLVAVAQKTPVGADRAFWKKAALLGVLEQIRVLIAANKLDEATTAIEQARQWAERTRPDDLTTALAIALLDSRAISQRARTASVTQPAESNGLTLSAGALAPLQQFAARSPAHRDLLYETVGGAWSHEPLPVEPGPFELQLLAGAVLYAEPSNQLGAGETWRISRFIAPLERAAKSLTSDEPAAARGEYLFLLGRAHYLLNQRVEAIGSLAEIVDKYPEHDRAAPAAEQATAIAWEWLQQPQGHDSSAARQAFVRAGRVLRTHSPQAPAATRLQFFIAQTLEQEGQLKAAADEYAAVPAADRHRLRAALGRARCLRALFLNSTAGSRPAELAARAADAARSAAAALSPTASAPAGAERDDSCLRAEILLLLANVLNHPSIHQYAEALAALKDFEKSAAGCPAALGPALRERILALRQLNRLGEARGVVEQFLRTDPDRAGPVMARLLQAMRDEVNAAADRGDDAAVKSIAKEAAELAGTLLDWSQKHPGRMTPAEETTIRLWRAWTILDGGSAAEALKLFDILPPPASSSSRPADTALNYEVRVGRAECLLALGKHDEALPIFTEIWQATPEHSPLWWQAFVGSLRCHSRLASDPQQIVQSIRQQRQLAPALGGPRWKRTLELLEAENLNRAATATRPQ